ncbi:MAG: diguanylate cyclase [Gammaproteobacteria bacterium]|nr:diguanylate cyclase [Gammaproteobacteria bacterium]NNJ91703.1 diguanylate cyclase [Gammaproteobacteria bacterium]
MFNRDFTLRSVVNRAIVRLAMLLLLVAGILGYYLVDRQYRLERAWFQQNVQLMAKQMDSVLPNLSPADDLEQIRYWTETLHDLLPEVSYDLLYDDEVIIRHGTAYGALTFQVPLSTKGWFLEARTQKTPLVWVLMEPLVILSGVLLLALFVLRFWGIKLTEVMLQDLRYIQNTTSLLAAQKSDSVIVEPRLYIREYKDYFSQLKKTILSIHEDADRAFSRDSLTAMPNEKQLEYQKKKIYEMASRNVEMMLVLLDIDDLNATNMIYGNETGDRLVKGIGDIVKGAIRITDDSFYLGDGQYLVVLVGMKAAEALKWYEFLTRRYEMLRMSLADSHETAPEISVSASAAKVLKSDQSLDDTLYRLRAVLKSIKQQSKGIIVMARDMQNPDALVLPKENRKDSAQIEEFHHPWQ